MYTYVCMYVSLYVYNYTYIYTDRGRSEERHAQHLAQSVPVPSPTHSAMVRDVIIEPNTLYPMCAAHLCATLICQARG